MPVQPAVLLIYTGGTIGMINDTETGKLKAFDFGDVYSQIPELKRLNVRLEANSEIKPVDSSEMTPEYWKHIAQIVWREYDSFDGFVILHGSDTMAFTASALSFMLQGIEKPVILTGSQLPIGTIRTDGKENLITAIEIAAAKNASGASMVQEVAVYFEYSLYRGNRVSKVSASSFEAFRSPNFPPLAVAGVHIDYNAAASFAKPKRSLFTDFDSRVALIKLFPGMYWPAYRSLFDYAETKAVILETFGSGNAASDKLFQQYVSGFIAAGGAVLNITQCSTGTVEQGKYETSSFFEQIGVISGRDLTTEAAVAKMMYALGKASSVNEIRTIFSESVVGE